LGETWKQPLDVVRAGIKLIEYLGVEGKNISNPGKRDMEIVPRTTSSVIRGKSGSSVLLLSCL